MASGVTATLAAGIIDHITGTTALPATITPLRLALVTDQGSTTAAGNELPNTSRPQLAFPAAGGAPPGITNTNQLVVACGASGYLTGIEVWDSAPTRKWFAPLAQPRQVVTGDTLVFAVGSLAFQIASP